ncbi:hypothetical protein AALP_AAs49602U000100, partial [Arabis alpina]
MVSLLLACTRKTSDPDKCSTGLTSLKRHQTVPHGLKNKGWFLRFMFTIGSIVRLVWNTIVDTLLLFAT